MDQRERQAEAEQPVGPRLHLGQPRPQPGRRVLVQPPRVALGQGGVLLGPGRDVRRRLGGAEAAQARSLEVREVRGHARAGGACPRAPPRTTARPGRRRCRASTGPWSGVSRKPARGVDGRHRDHAVRQPGQHARAGRPRRAGPGSSAWRTTPPGRRSPARPPTSRGSSATSSCTSRSSTSLHQDRISSANASVSHTGDTGAPRVQERPEVGPDLSHRDAASRAAARRAGTRSRGWSPASRGCRRRCRCGSRPAPGARAGAISSVASLSERAEPVAAVLGHHQGVVLVDVVGAVRQVQLGVAAELTVGRAAAPPR